MSPVTVERDALREALKAVSSDQINNLWAAIAGPLEESVAKIVNQAPSEVADFLEKSVKPIVAFEVIAGTSQDVAVSSAAKRRANHLKMQTILDAARYGVNLQQRNERELLAVVDTGLGFLRKLVLNV
jgi:hypothetical protein